MEYGEGFGPPKGHVGGNGRGNGSSRRLNQGCGYSDGSGLGDGDGYSAWLGSGHGYGYYGSGKGYAMSFVATAADESLGDGRDYGDGNGNGFGDGYDCGGGRGDGFGDGNRPKATYDFTGKSVFLSGPMTGRPDWNRAAFADAERAMRKASAREVFNPAADAPIGEDPHTHGHWMLWTLRELTRMAYCHGDWGNHTPHYDVLALLPGWESSEGARVEKTVAEACGMEVVELG